MTEFQGSIVEGAYYERVDGCIVGPARSSYGSWNLTQCYYHPNGTSMALPRAECWDLTRRVYITHADPVEVVAELRRLEDEANAFICDDDDYREDNAGEAYGRAADLVESMLGLARCGEDCNGNCELTAHGPTKAEAKP